MKELSWSVTIETLSFFSKPLLAHGISLDNNGGDDDKREISVKSVMMNDRLAGLKTSLAMLRHGDNKE